MWYPSPPDKQNKAAPETATVPEAVPSQASPANNAVERDASPLGKAAAASAPGTEYWLP